MFGKIGNFLKRTLLLGVLSYSLIGPSHLHGQQETPLPGVILAPDSTAKVTLDCLTQKLFSYENFNAVDTSLKIINVDLCFGDDSLSSIYFNHVDLVARPIRDHFLSKNILVNLQFVDSLNFDIYKPGEHMGVNVVGLEKWMDIFATHSGMDTSSTIGFLKYHLSGMFMQGVSYNKTGFAAINVATKDQRLTYFLEKLMVRPKLADKILTADLIRQAKNEIKIFTVMNALFEFPDNYTPRNLARSIVHDLHHMFGIYHSFEFTDDPVADYLETDPAVPNLMSYDVGATTKERPLGADLNEFQVKILHSFLNKGKVYQQLKVVDFNYHKYIVFLQTANNYHAQPYENHPWKMLMF